jgi:hypothetical protein
MFVNKLVSTDTLDKSMWKTRATCSIVFRHLV